MIPTQDDVRMALAATLSALSELPDDAWDAMAADLEWTCRETAAHVGDCFIGYAMQLTGNPPPLDCYVKVLEPAPVRPGAPTVLVYPLPEAGTVGVVSMLDATGGVLAAVVEVTAPSVRGYHPLGVSDASGFAAMGIVELILHAFDILSAHDVQFRADDSITRAVLERIFPQADLMADPWDELLSLSGRTPSTRGTRWRWHSEVR